MEHANILIVEDEKTQRTLLTDLLKKEGYDSSDAGNGVDALNIFKKKAIDIV